MDAVTTEKNANRVEEMEIPREGDQDNVSSHTVNTFTTCVYTDPTPFITGESLSTQYTSSGKFFKCHVCKIEIAGIVPFEQHLNGSKHKKHLRKLRMRQKYGAKYLESLQCRESGVDVSVESNEIEPHGDDNLLVRTCDVCNKTCSGLDNFQLHMRGKNHKKQLLKMQLIKDLEKKMDVNAVKSIQVLDKSADVTMAQEEPLARCVTCNVKFSRLVDLREHLSGNAHKKKAYFRNLSKRIEEEVNSAESESRTQMELCDETSEDTDSFARGRACKKSFSGPVPYRQHLISETHEKKTKEVAQLCKMKSVSRQ